MNTILADDYVNYLKFSPPDVSHPERAITEILQFLVQRHGVKKIQVCKYTYSKVGVVPIPLILSNLHERVIIYYIKIIKF